MTTHNTLQDLTVHLAAPRGCCAGVDRAIRTVEITIKRYGAPVYVRHEIVHNQYVVERLRKMGAVFIDELKEIPPTDRPVILSAHGAPKNVYDEATKRQLLIIDATCPLVSKVHREAEHFHRSGIHVLLIGHRGHAEVIGTMGQLPTGAVTLIETVEEAKNVIVPDNVKVGCLTQTTLSVMETATIIKVLKKRFPQLKQPRTSDICFATTNRQLAVDNLAKNVDLFLVIGAPNSSNSRRLVDVAVQKGCPAQLVAGAQDLPLNRIKKLFSSSERSPAIGITASASAPEVLVQDVLTTLAQHFRIKVITQEMDESVAKEESVVFRSPRLLRSAS